MTDAHHCCLRELIIKSNVGRHALNVIIIIPVSYYMPIFDSLATETFINTVATSYIITYFTDFSRIMHIVLFIIN